MSAQDKTFTCYADPGHSWLVVTARDLADAWIGLRDFPYAPLVCGSNYYLEEDCLLPFFVKAYQAKHGRKPEIRDVYVEDTPIRDYPSAF